MESATTHTGSAATTAIVCRAKGVTAPAELRAALTRKGFAVEDVETTYLAAARAMLLTRGSSSRRVFVVLVQPSKLVRPQELVRALGASAPTAACWVYEPGAAGEQLRAVTAEDLGRWASSGNCRLMSRPEEGEKPSTSAISASLEASGPVGTPDANGSHAPTYQNPGAGGTPSLRLAGAWGDTGLSPHPQENPAAGDAPPQQLLSDEELAMLLGDDTGAAESGT